MDARLHSSVRSVLIASSIALAFPGLSRATTDPGFDQYLTTFEHISSPTFGRVNCIIRDDRGFLWFGTTRGLCRYDGYEARVFSNGSTLNMKRQNITTMTQLDSRTLLIGTAEGLWKFNLDRGEFTSLPEARELSDKGITVLARDARGHIWIGTESLGVFRFGAAEAGIQHYSKHNGLSDNNVLSLLFDRTGRLWVGTMAGLNMLDSSTRLPEPYVRNSASDRQLRSYQITALLEKEPGEVWIGTNHGLYALRQNAGEIRRVHLPSSIPHTVMSMTHDSSGRVWVGVSDLGLLAYENGAFQRFTTLHDPGRTLSTIRVLYVDPVATRREHLFLWAGARSGINKVVLSQNPFSTHTRGHNGLQLNRGAVLTMREDRSGMLWLGLWGGGLNGLQKVNGEYLRVAIFEKTASSPNALPHNDVGELLEDRRGRLWTGTPNGLAVFDRQRKLPMILKHVAGDPASIVSNKITSLCEDRAGTMWVGTRGGLSEKLPGEPIRFKHHLHTPADAHPVGGNVISSLLEDYSSQLWVGTFGRGLLRRNTNGSFTSFTHPADSLGINENWVYTFVNGGNGIFWLSTNAGLVSFDPRTGLFARHFIEHHLNEAHIFDIAEDRHGDLWLSTNVGLVTFSPKRKTFIRLNEKHGFPFTELRSGFFRNSAGKLLVGGLDGFAEFDPDSVTPISAAPTIALTSVTVFDQQLSTAMLAQPKIRLSHDQNFFSFSFAALDYVNPAQNRFAYKMEGIDKDWVEAGTRNYASYTNVDPGEYVFHVKGSNSANVWDERGTSLMIIISPPYWKTWWFRILVMIVLVAAAYTGYRYRLRKALEVERMRLRIADDLHDDVGSNLSTIAMVSRTVQRDPDLSPTTRSKLKDIYDTAVKTSEGMKDIVWFIKPKDDTIDDLLLRMKDTASSLLADIGHEFHAPANGGATHVTIDFKRNFFLGFKEILTNIVKHSSATTVKIQVTQRDGTLEVHVLDNGKGFNEHQVHRGNGLGSLRSRARTIGGLCEISSKQGEGTQVRFSGRL